MQHEGLTPRHGLGMQAGVVAAFGLVRGIAISMQMLVDASSAAADGQGLAAALAAVPVAALSAGESMLVFAFASVAVEFAWRKGYAQPRQ